MIRELSMEAAKRVKVDGAKNDLIERIAKHDHFKAIHNDLDKLLDPKLFIGRCPQQVDELISEHVQPILDAHQDLLSVQNQDQIKV